MAELTARQLHARGVRRFLNDGTRSSLPQYRQTSFSDPDVAPDDRSGRCEAFVVFVAWAAFGLAPTACFFAGATDWSVLPPWLTNAPGADLASVFK
jgi:hypothetical protein